MPRPTRVYAPGVGFHVVASTQGGEHWFDDDVCDRLFSDIPVAARASGHRVLACVIMRNHFHVIVKHGRSPLAWMMQRVLQRAAARVKKSRPLKGHVFGQRYWAEPIPTAKYLRRAIVYTHLNPCKARICEGPALYRWSTHNDYLALTSATAGANTDALDGLMLFADESVELRSVIANYQKFISLCEERRRAGITGDWLLPGGLFWGQVPTASLGDAHWVNTFTQFDGGTGIPRRQIDIRTQIVRILRSIDPDLEIDSVRFGHRCRAMTTVRRQLVCALLSAECRPSAIAKYLGLSPSVVSRIRTSMRLGVAQQQ